jgi:hypothetical protein
VQSDVTPDLPLVCGVACKADAASLQPLTLGDNDVGVIFLPYTAYLPLSHCVWRFRLVNPAKRVRFAFGSFDLQPPTTNLGCLDSVRLLEGDEKLPKPLAKTTRNADGTITTTQPTGGNVAGASSGGGGGRGELCGSITTDPVSANIPSVRDFWISATSSPFVIFASNLFVEGKGFALKYAVV